jgi:hypothetical protein
VGGSQAAELAESDGERDVSMTEEIRQIAAEVKRDQYAMEQSARKLVQLLNDLVSCGFKQRAIAKWIGVSPAYLCDVLKERRFPGNKFLAGCMYSKLPKRGGAQ